VDLEQAEPEDIVGTAVQAALRYMQKEQLVAQAEVEVVDVVEGVVVPVELTLAIQAVEGVA
jgi:hypothetical protein